MNNADTTIKSATKISGRESNLARGLPKNVSAFYPCPIFIYKSKEVMKPLYILTKKNKLVNGYRHIAIFLKKY
jgi:hypothetical protein